MLLQLLLIKWYQLALSEIINTAFGILVVFLLLHVFNVWCLGLKLMKRIHLHFSFKLDFGEKQRAYSAFIYCLVLCVQRRRTTQEVWGFFLKKKKKYLNVCFLCTSKEKADHSTFPLSLPSPPQVIVVEYRKSQLCCSKCSFSPSKKGHSV